jgi:hypothetical protein
MLAVEVLLFEGVLGTDVSLPVLNINKKQSIKKKRS